MWGGRPVTVRTVVRQHGMGSCHPANQLLESLVVPWESSPHRDDSLASCSMTLAHLCYSTTPPEQLLAQGAAWICLGTNTTSGFCQREITVTAHLRGMPTHSHPTCSLNPEDLLSGMVIRMEELHCQPCSAYHPPVRKPPSGF